MKCFFHPTIDAVGTCSQCGKGTCRECVEDVGGTLLCITCMSIHEEIAAQESAAVAMEAAQSAEQIQRKIRLRFLLSIAASIFFTTMAAPTASKDPSAPIHGPLLLTFPIYLIGFFYVIWSCWWGVPPVVRRFKRAVDAFFERTGCILIANPLTWLILMMSFGVLALSFGVWLSVLGGGIYQYRKALRLLISVSSSKDDGGVRPKTPRLPRPLMGAIALVVFVLAVGISMLIKAPGEKEPRSTSTVEASVGPKPLPRLERSTSSQTALEFDAKTTGPDDSGTPTVSGQISLAADDANDEPNEPSGRLNNDLRLPRSVLLLHLEEGSGVEDLVDSSGNGVAARAVGTTVVEGRSGHARLLRNDVAGMGTEYITLGNSRRLNPTTELTFEAWIYPKSDAEGLVNGIPIVSREDSWMGDIAYIFEMGIPPCGLHLYDGELNVCAPDVVALNRWSHVAFTVESKGSTKTGRIFVNGNISAEQTVDGRLKANNLTTYIGRRWGRSGGSQYNRGFNGAIDEVKFYDVALAPAVIKTSATTLESRRVQEAVEAGSKRANEEESGQARGTAAVPIAVTVEEGEFEGHVVECGGTANPLYSGKVCLRLENGELIQARFDVRSELWVPTSSYPVYQTALEPGDRVRVFVRDEHADKVVVTRPRMP